MAVKHKLRKLPATGPAPWGYQESGGIVPEMPEVAPGTPTRDATLKPAKRITNELTDAYVEAVHAYAEGQTSWLFDTKQPGLRCRIGKNRASWVYYHDNRRHGRGRKGNSKGRVTSKVLGQFPAMTVDDARRAAAIEGGKLASGTRLPGKRSAQKFESAWAAYLDRLKSKVANANKQRQREGIATKPARWAIKAEFWGKQWLLPEFGSWTLADMVAHPEAVQAFHTRVTSDSGSVTANRCCQLIRAAYRRASKTDVSLPRDRDPTSGVDFHPEKKAKRAMKRRDFPRWLTAWRALPTAPPATYHKGMWAATRKPYFLFCLFAGTRPGEAARIRWCDVKPSERVIEIPAAKADNLIRVIMSAPIARVLKRARDIGKPKDGNALVFPFCGQLRDDLPSKGHAFRHTWRTIAAALKIETTLVRVMQGWADDEVSEDYVNEQELSGDPALREAQRKMSAKIISLLGADPTKGNGWMEGP